MRPPWLAVSFISRTAISLQRSVALRALSNLATRRHPGARNAGTACAGRRMAPVRHGQAGNIKHSLVVAIVTQAATDAERALAVGAHGAKGRGQQDSI